MSKARDLANLASTATVMATDAEVAVATSDTKSTTLMTMGA